MSELYKYEVPYCDQALWVNVAQLKCSLALICLTHGFLYATSHSKVCNKGHLENRNGQILVKRKYN